MKTEEIAELVATFTREDTRIIASACRARLAQLCEQDPFLYILERTSPAYGTQYATNYQGSISWLAHDLNYAGGPLAEHSPTARQYGGTFWTSRAVDWAQFTLDCEQEKKTKPAGVVYKIRTVDKKTGQLTPCF